LKNTVLGIFKFSKVPESVAFIMDGNRRYAKNKGMEKIKGHHEGFDKLIQVMEWCLILGIKVVTVYALSIDNFNRPKEELDGLMELVEEKFSKLSEKNALFQQQGIKVQFLGNLEFVDKKIRDIVDKMVEDTKHNSK
jgi:ditrans,polycis-polyprenyl diphosphate synthase